MDCSERLGHSISKDSKGKRPVDEIDEDSDSSTNSGPFKRRAWVISGPSSEGCSYWAGYGGDNLGLISSQNVTSGSSVAVKVGFYRELLKKLWDGLKGRGLKSLGSLSGGRRVGIARQRGFLTLGVLGVMLLLQKTQRKIGE